MSGKSSNSFPMPLRILLLTYAFPPLQSAEAFLSAKALGELPGASVDVLTLNPESLGLPLDRSLDSYVADKFNCVHRINPPAWCSPSVFSWLRYFAHLPDRCAIFNADLYHRAFDLDLSRYDLILSWSQWHSIHLVAAKIKKNFPSVRWVAHLSDPWADNPYLPNNRIYRSLQKALEKNSLQYADFIQFTTDETEALVMAKYNNFEVAKNSGVVPHCFVDELYETSESSEREGKLILRYLGNFYRARTPAPLLDALLELYQELPELLDGVSFEFVGKTDDMSVFERARALLPPECVIFRESVPYRQSLSLMKSADYLLIIDAPFETSVFLPSKLVDYLGADKPIIALSPDGATARLVQSYGGLRAEPKSLRKIKDLLKTVLSNRGETFDGYCDIKRGVRQQFSNVTVAANFMQQLQARWPELI